MQKHLVKKYFYLDLKDKSLALYVCVGQSICEQILTSIFLGQQKLCWKKVKKKQLDIFFDRTLTAANWHLLWQKFESNKITFCTGNIMTPAPWHLVWQYFDHNKMSFQMSAARLTLTKSSKGRARGDA